MERSGGRRVTDPPAVAAHLRAGGFQTRPYCGLAVFHAMQKERTTQVAENTEEDFLLPRQHGFLCIPRNGKVPAACLRGEHLALLPGVRLVEQGVLAARRTRPLARN